MIRVSYWPRNFPSSNTIVNVLSYLLYNQYHLLTHYITSDERLSHHLFTAPTGLTDSGRPLGNKMEWEFDKSCSSIFGRRSGRYHFFHLASICLFWLFSSQSISRWLFTTPALSFVLLDKVSVWDMIGSA